jgi:serine phosphatase RsbU (regulator of sigma subunit)
VGHNKVIGIALLAVFVCAIFWMIGWAIFVFLTLIIATYKRNFEAGLLLIPLVLTMVGIAEPIMTGGLGDFGGGSYKSPLTIQAGPIPIHFAAIADFTGLLAIIVIIFVRFLRIHHEQERASGELAAARSVQELMIPREKVETPGYEVDSVYTPATEVGGDFFHIEPTSNGGLLVILGDVAGHGLQAAMNVSMLMGALRRAEEKSPARILESLNRVLTGSESFTTCQVAWFGPDGEVVVANAGHLPPYLNTQEVRLPGGLPLGVLGEITYDEVRLYLHPGDRLLMMSDGVVEARHGSGELFGFDRVHNLSNQSAFYIADAAKAFGQEDDITVLTIRRMPKAMAA